MKKVAVQMDPDAFDPENYYSKDDATYDLFTTCDSRDFKFNGQLWTAVLTLANDVAKDDEYIQNDDSYDSAADKEADRIDSAGLTVKRFLYDVLDDDSAEETFGRLTSEAIRDVIEFADYYYSNYVAEEEAVATMLSKVIGKKFKHGVMCGCSQGEYCKYICPDDLSAGMLSFIESVLFGTGTEYAISVGEIDIEGKTADEIRAEVMEDCYYDYTVPHNDEGVKQWIANITYGSHESSDVALINIAESRTITVNTYELV